MVRRPPVDSANEYAIIRNLSQPNVVWSAHRCTGTRFSHRVHQRTGSRYLTSYTQISDDVSQQLAVRSYSRARPVPLAP